MKTIKLFVAFLALSVLFAQACKSNNSKEDSTGMESSSNDETSSGENDAKSAMEEMAKSMEEMGKGSGEVVDYQVLKDALPESLAGLARTSHTGQKSSFANMKISTAEARYEEGDKSISATITDSGGFGIAMAGLAAWASMEMESESDSGYEKTTTINGHKAYEKYDKISHYGEISVIYDNRFILSLNSQNVAMNDLRDAVKKIDIKS